MLDLKHLPIATAAEPRVTAPSRLDSMCMDTCHTVSSKLQKLQVSREAIFGNPSGAQRKTILRGRIWEGSSDTFGGVGRLL